MLRHVWRILVRLFGGNSKIDFLACEIKAVVIRAIAGKYTLRI